MYKPNLLACAWPILYVRAPGLKSIEIAAGRNLAICALSRQPHFDVIAFRCGEPHVARRMDHNSVRQLEPLQNLFGIVHQGFQFLIGLFRPREFHQFDFIELMLTENSADVLAVGSGFAAETWSICGKLDRQSLSLNDAVAINIRDWNFGR